jgi:hypothetical protein
MALQQGGLGLVLTTLIVSAPPMAAAFFQGTLGSFMSYSAFGSIGAGGAGRDAQMAAQGRLAHRGAAPAQGRGEETKNLPLPFHVPVGLSRAPSAPDEMKHLPTRSTNTERFT